jgi:hypothetical protein
MANDEFKDNLRVFASLRSALRSTHSALLFTPHFSFLRTSLPIFNDPQQTIICSINNNRKLIVFKILHMTYYYRYSTLLPIFVFVFLLHGNEVSNSHKNLPVLKDSLFNMSTVMPGDEVASLSPFNKPIKQVTEFDRLDGYCGCHYDLQSEDDFPQVQIEVNQFISKKESRANYIMRKSEWVNMYGRQPEFISNLGDSASFYGNAEPDKCDDCGLQVFSGYYYITVGLKGYYDKVSAATKRNAAVNIVKRLFEKKPFLNSSR